MERFGGKSRRFRVLLEGGATGEKVEKNSRAAGTYWTAERRGANAWGLRQGSEKVLARCDLVYRAADLVTFRQILHPHLMPQVPARYSAIWPSVMSLVSSMI